HPLLRPVSPFAHHLEPRQPQPGGVGLSRRRHARRVGGGVVRSPGPALHRRRLAGVLVLEVTRKHPAGQARDVLSLAEVRQVMVDGVRGWGSVREWMRQHAALVEQVRARIRQEGGLRAADFESDQKRSGVWWNWKDEKTALECLFIQGELMIARRQGFQRVYD